jgi:dolichol kinase
MSLFPAGNSFPGRIAITTFLFGFMFAFATVAHMTDEQIASLPRPVIARIKRLQSSCARTGSRKELMGGTFLYCAVVSQFVLSSWTSPLNIMTMSALFLGDGLADPIGRMLGGSSQYRILNFGTKSVPGSTACFLASLAGAIMWGRLFVWAGHWGPSTGFDEANYIFSASW